MARSARLRRIPSQRAQIAQVALAIALAVGLAGWAACAGPAPETTTVLATAPRYQTLVLLPLNVATPLPAELEDSSEVVWSALRDYLRDQGAKLKTLPFPVARNLWLASIRDTRTAAKGRDPGFDEAAALFVRRLSENADFDAVIMGSLFVQRARLEGDTAHWDGVERQIAFESARRSVALPEHMTVEGAAPAASLHAVIFDATGSKLQERQTGLALLVRIRVGGSAGTAEDQRFSFIPIDQPFADRDQVRAGVARALAPFVPDANGDGSKPRPTEDGDERSPPS